eukprot:635259_1
MIYMIGLSQLTAAINAIRLTHALMILTLQILCVPSYYIGSHRDCDYDAINWTTFADEFIQFKNDQTQCAFEYSTTLSKHESTISFPLCISIFLSLFICFIFKCIRCSCKSNIFNSNP